MAEIFEILPHYLIGWVFLTIVGACMSIRLLRKWRLVRIMREITSAGGDVEVIADERWLSVGFSGHKMSDEQLSLIQKLPSCQVLALPRCEIPKGMAKNIASIPNLIYLDLSGTNVEDEDIKSFLKAPHLIGIYVNDTNVSDASVLALAEHPTLKLLGVKRCRVSENAMRQFKARKPFRDLH